MHRLRMRNDLRGTVETRENMLIWSPDRCHVLAQQLGRDPPPRVNDTRYCGRTNDERSRLVVPMMYTSKIQQWYSAIDEETVYKNTAWNRRSGSRRSDRAVQQMYTTYPQTRIPVSASPRQPSHTAIHMRACLSSI